MTVNFRSRMFEEESTLRRRIGKLKEFILSERYESLPEIDRKDLKEQLQHMEIYHAVLMRRVLRQCNSA